jgi:hypothetical protein
MPTTTATTATVEAASNTGRFYPDPESLTQKKRGPQTCSSVVGECASSPDEPASTPHLLDDPRSAQGPRARV